MTDQQIDPQAEETEAIDRIARTHDGRLLHRYLRRILETVYDLPEAGALQAGNGRRTLARDLMRLMASGIEAHSDRADQSILSRAGKPVSFRGASRATARRAQWESELASEFPDQA